jgi:hypothetical protein
LRADQPRPAATADRRGISAYRATMNLLSQRACLLGRYRYRAPFNSRNTDTPAIPALLLLRSH